MNGETIHLKKLLIDLVFPYFISYHAYISELITSILLCSSHNPKGPFNLLEVGRPEPEGNMINIYFITSSRLKGN